MIEQGLLKGAVLYYNGIPVTLMENVIVAASVSLPEQQTPATLPDEEEVPDNMSFEWYIHATLIKFHPDLSFEKREELVRGMQSNLSTPTGEGEAVAWIPVSERLPDYNIEVLVFGTRMLSNPQMGGNPPRVMTTMRQDLTKTSLERQRRKYQDENGFRYMENVTHWMPLPAKPQQP